MNDEYLISQLQQDWKVVDISIKSLQLSLDKCKKFGIKDEYTFEEFESFDSLTSKFSRTSDIFTQKILKTIMMLLRETLQTFIDRANLAEKLGIISSAESLKEIRDLRDQIVHEYLVDQLVGLYSSILEYSEKLIAMLNKANLFIKNRGWILS